jgi:hypothetical protein
MAGTYWHNWVTPFTRLSRSLRGFRRLLSRHSDIGSWKEQPGTAQQVLIHTSVDVQGIRTLFYHCITIILVQISSELRPLSIEGIFRKYLASIADWSLDRNILVLLSNYSLDPHQEGRLSTISSDGSAFCNLDLVFHPLFLNDLRAVSIFCYFSCGVTMIQLTIYEAI